MYLLCYDAHKRQTEPTQQAQHTRNSNTQHISNTTSTIKQHAKRNTKSKAITGAKQHKGHLHKQRSIMVKNKRSKHNITNTITITMQTQKHSETKIINKTASARNHESTKHIQETEITESNKQKANQVQYTKQNHASPPRSAEKTAAINWACTNLQSFGLKQG